MEDLDRLRIWTEQGNVHISQLFFHFYKQLKITDVEAMLIMHIAAFHAEGNKFPTPHHISMRMNLSENEVSSTLQRVLQKGFMSIKQEFDNQGVLFEVYSLFPLWNRLVNLVQMDKNKTSEEDKKEAEGEIFRIFEQEFGRLLSPMEIETISMWFDQDNHSPDIIKAALKEAVLAQKLSLRYVDRILFEWKKKNIRTVSDAEKQARNFRAATVPARQTTQEAQTKKVQFYNWLEERE